MVDVTESLWSLDAERNAAGQKVQLLTVSLVRPGLTADEVMWKKGRLHGCHVDIRHFATFCQADLSQRPGSLIWYR